jgi:LacI family transcriptional regulator
MQAVTEAGLRVPQDVSVVGFDNIREAELVTPGLTTVASPLSSLGSAAVQHLLSEHRSESGDQAPLLLPSRLVVRGSTARAAI